VAGRAQESAQGEGRDAGLMAIRWSSFEGELSSVRTGLADQENCKLSSEIEQFDPLWSREAHIFGWPRPNFSYIRGRPQDAVLRKIISLLIATVDSIHAPLSCHHLTGTGSELVRQQFSLACHGASQSLCLPVWRSCSVPRTQSSCKYIWHRTKPAHSSIKTMPWYA
jgi:hypothetical protein